MPRPLRIAPAGVCFHVLNRGNNRQPLFRKAADYAAFVSILTEACERFEVDLFCWCLMPNHWHLVLRPRTHSALSRFMAWLSITHVRRHHGHYPSFSGHLYQGRYKSFPVETDEYFLSLCRYVEANPLRAKLVERAEGWSWSSLGQRRGGNSQSKSVQLSPSKSPPNKSLAKLKPRSSPPAHPREIEWPVDRPRHWTRLVNEALSDEERKEIESCLLRSCPLGSERWSKRVATQLALRQTLSPRGRPRKPLEMLSVRQQQRRKRQFGA